MPRRRCVGCGRIAPKSELLRLAVDPDDRRPPKRVLIDLAGRLPGRGAYLCRGPEPTLADPACLERAQRRGGIARALRSAVTLERKLVESEKSPPAREVGRRPTSRAPLFSIEP